MIELLTYLKGKLNSIHVHGEADVDALKACFSVLNQMLAAYQMADKQTEPQKEATPDGNAPDQANR